jgi:hypothetical protein
MSSQPKSFNVKASHKFISSATNSSQPQSSSEASSSVYSFSDSVEGLSTTSKTSVDTESTRKQGSSKGISIKSSSTSIEDYY